MQVEQWRNKGQQKNITPTVLTLQTGIALPSFHSLFMAPSTDLTIKTGITIQAVLELLQKNRQVLILI